MAEKFLSFKYLKQLLMILLILQLALLARPISSRIFSNVGWVYTLTSTNRSTTKQISETKHIDQIFEKAYKIDPKNYSAILGISQFFSLAGNYDKAQNVLENLIADGFNRTIAYFQLGNLAFASGDESNALDAWRSAHAEKFFFTLAKQAKEKHEIENAIFNLNQALLIDPNYSQAIIELAQIYYSAGEFEKTRPILDSYLRKNSDRVGYSLYGQTLEALGEWEMAIQAYQEAAKLGELWDGYIAIGDIYFQQGKYELANQWYSRANLAFPKVTGVYLKLGDVALRTGQTDKALEFYSTALQKSPKNPQYLYRMGLWHFQENNPEKALAYFLDSNRYGLEPDYWYYKMSADLYSQLGNCKNALRNYQHAALAGALLSSEEDYIQNRIKALEESCK